MANNVITVIQPGGTIGTKYNVRATGLRYFAAPSISYIQGSGYYINCPDITTNWEGLTFVIKFSAAPGNNLSKLYINRNDQIYDLKLVSGQSLSTLTDVSKPYLVTYSDGAFWIMDDITVGTTSASISSGNTLVPNGDAIYNYVTSMVANRWEYVVCQPIAAEIPNGATYKDGGTTITGTMAASAGTEFKIYLVKHDHSSIGTNGTDAYDEWITVKTGQSTYSWEKIGNTDIDINAIANGIAATVIGSILPHKYVEPTGTGSVEIGTHDHSFIGSTLTSTGSVTATGSITVGGESGTAYTPTGVIATNADSGSVYAPAGTVLSTLEGTDKYVRFTGTEATISVSGSNVTTGDPSDTSATVVLTTNVDILSGRIIGSVVPIGTVTGNGTVNGSSNEVSGHTHQIAPFVGTLNESISGSSFTISSKSDTQITLMGTTNTGGRETFTVPIETASVTTQPEFSIGSGGTHTHIGTLPQFSAVGTISTLGTVSSYTVENEVLTLTPNTLPGSAVTVAISTQGLSIANGGDHIHTASRTANVGISVIGGKVLLVGTMPEHTHSLQGTISNLTVSVGTLTTTNAGTHSHTVDVSASSIASALSLSIGTIYAAGTIGNHTHTIASLSLSTTYTPAGTLANGTSSNGYNIKPAGTVNSSFTGTSTKFAFIGTQTKLGFSGTSASVTVTGTPEGTVAAKYIGTKTVYVGTTTGTLDHHLIG